MHDGSDATGGFEMAWTWKSARLDRIPKVGENIRMPDVRLPKGKKPAWTFKGAWSAGFLDRIDWFAEEKKQKKQFKVIEGPATDWLVFWRKL